MATVPERYLLLGEPDHVFIRAPPLWATPTRPAAFPFFYIEPTNAKYKSIIARYNKKKVPPDALDPVGELGVWGRGGKEGGWGGAGGCLQHSALAIA